MPVPKIMYSDIKVANAFAYGSPTFGKKIRLFKIYLNNGEIFLSDLVKHTIYINNHLMYISKNTPLKLLLSKFYKSISKGYNDDDFQNILISADSIKIFNDYY